MFAAPPARGAQDTEPATGLREELLSGSLGWQHMVSDRGAPDCGQAGGREGLVPDWSDNCQCVCVCECVLVGINCICEVI